MPSTIPYDPSLVLGSIVHPERLEKVVAIARLQQPADAAQVKLNSLITLQRNTEMTIQELLDMHITPDALLRQQAETTEAIKAAAEEYGRARIAAETAIQPIRASIPAVDYEIESPLDYNRSQLKNMGLSTDSLQLNVQYFSRIVNEQASDTHASNISSFVSESLRYFGQHHAAQAARAVQEQVNTQLEDHEIAGTLVISISCTHRDAQVFAPLIVDVDKAVRAWNAVYPDDMIRTDDAVSTLVTQALADTPAERRIHLISGATFGSSFVGMVHILNTTNTVSHQQMQSVAANLQSTFDLGGWFAASTGGFGVESSFSDSAKALLSTQNIQSHCSLVTMGIIPSIKSNQVMLGVKQLADFDPAKEMERLAALQGATAESGNTVSSAAEAARTGQQMITLQNSTITSTLTGLADIDDGQNSIIDINSMMTGMDDYIQKCVSADENVGVPINYYLKSMSKSDIARAWLHKYYPAYLKNGAGSVDDSDPTEN